MYISDISYINIHLIISVSTWHGSPGTACWAVFADADESLDVSDAQGTCPWGMVNVAPIKMVTGGWYTWHCLKKNAPKKIISDRVVW